MRQPLIIIYFNFKYIQNISVRTAEFYIAVLRLRRFSSVSQYIRIGESDMHRHRAGYRLTAGGGDSRDSATENKRRFCGKCGNVR